MNIILGWFVLSVVFMIGSDSHLVISGVAKNSPAEFSGIKTGDIVSEVKFNELTFKDPIKASDFSGIFKNFPGNPIDIKVSRNEKIFEMKVAGRVNPPTGEGALGVTLAEIGFSQKSFFQSFGSGFITTLQILKDIFIGFYDLITRSFREPEILNSVTGPIGIFMLARETSAFGFIYLLQLMALISLNLAVLNVIPFPALDGGRVLILIIEQFKKKPISQKFQMIYNTTGFLVLILLMMVVSIKDIRNLF